MHIETLDADSDGVINADTDDDSGAPDQDAFPLDAAGAVDTDDGDNADTDDDGDGYPDAAVATVALLNGGERTFCGTDENGYWCEAARYGKRATELVLWYGIGCLSDRASLAAMELACWGNDGVAAPSLSSQVS